MSKLYIHKRYGQVPNNLLNRSDMSLKAKGMFAFLQSKPDEWSFSIDRIAAQNKEGEYAVRAALKELEKHGYLKRKPMKNEAGKWDGYAYTLYEDKQEGVDTDAENPSAVNPTTDNPSTGEPVTLSKKDSSKKDISKKEESKDMQRPKAALRSSKKRSLKGLTRDEVIAVYRSNREAPPEGFGRPQVLAAVLDHTKGFKQIVKQEGWGTIMMRLGQVFNHNRKVQPEYRDIMDVATSWRKIPIPKGGSPSLNYLIAALTKEAVGCMEDRLERQAQEHKYGIPEAIEGAAEYMRARPRRREA